MTLVMDGVRRVHMRPDGAAMVLPTAPVIALPKVVKPQPKPRPAMKRVHASTARANAGLRYITGMDGVRRAVPMRPVLGTQSDTETATSPSAVLRNIQAPAMLAQAPASAAQAINPTAPALFTDAVDELNLGEQAGRAAWHFPRVAWKRPAIAFSLVATALVASAAAVHGLDTPAKITASADSQPAANAASATSMPSAAPAASAVAPTPHKTGLQQILDDFVAANGDKFGIVVKDLNTGETATINPSRQITSASLYKLFVAQRIYQRIDLGQLDYNQPAGGGTGRNVDECLRIMINISDNACGRALGSILGWGAQNAALKAEGYKETTLQTPQQTSAEDVATLFERLYSGTLVSANSSDRFLALLKDQRVNNRLPQGLPAGTVIAHKTGDLDGVVHDAGIVYGPKTNYLVVVTSGPWNAPGNAPAMFADLSQKLWNYFEQ